MATSLIRGPKTVVGLCTSLSSVSSGLLIMVPFSVTFFAVTSLFGPLPSSFVAVAASPPMFLTSDIAITFSNFPTTFLSSNVSAP